ncbi:alpha-2-HS-glycoprotein, isoform CRA_c [Rattus norvegicus]|uniref:Alpha-2-HS-glycoprotein, isoform CRA_c n=1 Tax=Rattus norvegicus TaxID=10116 RepID=A6JS46_RAT|nr:alpha-2-HS-glycoprotein, isoform CRA_c [Rattus norvegicus]
MKSLVLLLCFAQLWSCQSAPQGAGLGFRELACDDPETEHQVPHHSLNSRSLHSPEKRGREVMVKFVESQQQQH